MKKFNLVGAVTNWHGLLTIKLDRMKNKITGYKLTQSNKSDLQFLSEWIDLKTDNSDETATMIIEKITEMLKEKKNYKAETLFGTQN